MKHQKTALPNSLLKLHNICLDSRLKNISLECVAGQCWHILGANGSGKSSLLSAVAALLDTDSGYVKLKNKELCSIDSFVLAEYRAFVTQHYSADFDLTVAECFEFFYQSNDLPELIESFLKVEELLDKPLGHLSGGEAQRVHLARNLCQVWQYAQSGQALILLDEPTQQLDPMYQQQVLKLVTTLVELGNLVIQSHHDVNQSLNYADCVVLMRNGEIFAQGEARSVLTAQNLSRLYNQEFRKIADKSLKHGYILVN